jgi:YesN/AraC family two-component response regulator
MKLYIQNMVSLRCKLLVKSELEKLNIRYNYVNLGEVGLLRPISPTKREKLKEVLHKSGLEVMDDAKTILIEKIINIIVEMVHYADEQPKEKFSVFLERKMGQNYHKLSELFTKTKGVTIEQFIKIHKIERVKELIIYDELNLTEISYLMHYSSVAHLSTQFKQVTGITPTIFKNQSKKERINLEDL